MAIAKVVTNWIFRRQVFCCCFPVRFGVIVMSALSIALSGFLSIALWFEVSTNSFMSEGERAAFVVAGLVETFLLVASVFGLIGACARKQLFVTVYAAFLYFNLLLNFGVAIYFLWMITHAANTDIVEFCQQGIRNTQAEKQCAGLLKITKGVFWGIALVFLSIEAYGAIMVTRYVIKLRGEKRGVRTSREVHRQSAFEAYNRRLASVGSDGEVLLQKDFDPYEALYSPPTVRGERRATELDTEKGGDEYGGGQLAHKATHEEEQLPLDQRPGSGDAPQQKRSSVPLRSPPPPY